MGYQVVSKLRAQRLANRIRKEFSEMLIFEISDPRLSGVSITDVTVDKELAYADIYVSAFEGASISKDVLSGLKHAEGFIRRELSQRIVLHTFPLLRFHWDPTPERAERIESLIASLHEESEPSGKEIQANQDTDEIE